MTRVTCGPAADAAGSEAVVRLLERWDGARPPVALGAASVVLGGLVAAVTGPTGFERGSWVAAYLVLVGGVAQVVLGAGQAWLAPVRPQRGVVRAQVATWNAASLVVIGGTVAGMPVLTSLGGATVMALLVAFLVVVRGSTVSPRWVGTVYVGLVALVLLSAPVGLVLAWARRG